MEWYTTAAWSSTQLFTSEDSLCKDERNVCALVEGMGNNKKTNFSDDRG